ncbi:MAG: MFS transporter [Gammaproteobacteria bacterium]
MSHSVEHSQSKTLAACCSAHALHDGLVAMQYVLLPILAQTFNLSYAQVGLLRGINSGALAAFEVPSGVLSEWFGERRLLVLGLVGAGLGYLGVASSSSFYAIAGFFLLAGTGSGFQHAISSSIIVNNFDDSGRRRALGTYNSLGDAGKLSFTALFSLGIGMGLAWNTVVTVMAVAAILFGLVVHRLLRHAISTHTVVQTEKSDGQRARGWGVKDPSRFSALSVLVFLDSTIQAVFLTFIAFILLGKGAGPGTASAGVVLALAGGMAGKFLCGFLAARLGDRFTFVSLQLLTVAGILAIIWSPLSDLIPLLPLIGMVVQGSSTVTYGSVADFIQPNRQSRGYALIYTVANGASVGGPFVFGWIADRHNIESTLWILALIAAATIPLCYVLSSSDRSAHASLT